MRSIQSKFILLIMVGIILSSVLIGSIGISRYTVGANNKSAETINMLAEYNATEINGIMGRVEQSVEVIAGCAQEYITDTSSLSDDASYNAYMTYLRPIMLNAAYSTYASVSVYIRFNPELTTPDAGLFYIRRSNDAYFTLEPNTDISLYEKDDIEHVGWYYIPVENALEKGRHSTWMAPYHNKNIDIFMISYVVPVFCGDKLLGIVGMDIDFTMLQQLVDSIRVYDTGFAYLAKDDDNFTIVHHRTLAEGTTGLDESIEFVSVIDQYDVDIENATLYDYEYDGVKKKMSYRKLNNNVNLVITAPLSEINHDRNVLLIQIACATAVVCVVFIFITAVICRSLVRPLERLTDETKKIADGDLSVEIRTHTHDEIGILADSFRDMAEKLRVYIARIHRLAHTDALTGAENKTAYDEAVQRLSENHDKGVEYAVVVLDINGLKVANDTKGHISGDELINRCVEIIRYSFPGCPVYRIGGDEFVVLLTDEFCARREEFMQTLADTLEEDRLSHDERFAVLASGIAYSDGAEPYEDVFGRADKLMYENKAVMKGFVAE